MSCLNLAQVDNWVYDEANSTFIEDPEMAQRLLQVCQKGARCTRSLLTSAAKLTRHRDSLCCLPVSCCTPRACKAQHDV